MSALAATMRPMRAVQLATITLLTDFGHQDIYVGVMRGVIRSIAPAAQVIDLCHEVAPQAVAQAGFLLEAAAPFFPAGTVHVAVVDPGVGSDRRIICALTPRATYLAPDNGLLARVLERDPPDVLVSVESTEHALAQVSDTFHGRDIFAPVSAHLANGIDPRELGPEVSAIASLPSEAPVRLDETRMEARVLHVDRFGNLVTNLVPAGDVRGIRVNAREVAGPLCRSYAARPQGEPLLIVGSSGYLEVSVNGGSAQALLGVGVGDRLEVEAARRNT